MLDNSNRFMKETRSESQLINHLLSNSSLPLYSFSHMSEEQILHINKMSINSCKGIFGITNHNPKPEKYQDCSSNPHFPGTLYDLLVAEQNYFSSLNVTSSVRK